MYWNRIQFWKQRCSIIEFWIYFNRQNLKNLSIFRFPLAISSRSRYSKKIFYFETTFLSTLPLLSSRKACFQSRNIRLARLIGLTRWAISPETPPSDAVCLPLPLPRPREEGKRNIFARDRCTGRTFIRMAVVVSRHDGGRRRISGSAVSPPPLPSASKSLYQPGNYTSFRAISSTLVEGIGGGGGGGGLLLVSRWRAHHHLALVSFHCDSPSPAPLSPGRY